MFTREEYENLQSRIRELEATITEFQAKYNDEVTREIRRLPDAVANAAGEMDGVEQGNQPSNVPPVSRHGSWTSEVASPWLGLDDATTTSNLEVYHKDNLPAEEAVHAAIATLGDSTADMFFIMTIQESEKLLVQVYRKAKTEITQADICLVCAFCALGSHFTSDPVAEDKKKALFKTAWMLIDDCFEIDGVQSLRAFLCLALFTLLDKRSSARLMLTSGLQIAQGLETSVGIDRSSLEDFESFRKMYRSLILLDSYLTTKLVHHSVIGSEEMNFVRSSAIEGRISNEDNFVTGFSSLALLVRNIPSNLYSNLFTNDEHGLVLVGNCMQQLSAWHDALPDGLRLSTLIAIEQSDIPAGGTWTAILSLHEAYLSVVVLLHRGLIPSLLEQEIAGQRWRVGGSIETANEWYSRTIITAQQCIRINTLLIYTSSAVFRGCWLLLCEIFICSCLLVADVALDISTSLSSRAEENLQHISEAMETMENMHGVNDLAAGSMTTLRPMYHELKELQKASTETLHKHNLEPAAGSLLRQAVRILRSINQHRSRQSLANALSSIREVSDW